MDRTEQPNHYWRLALKSLWEELSNAIGSDSKTERTTALRRMLTRILEENVPEIGSKGLQNWTDNCSLLLWFAGECCRYLGKESNSHKEKLTFFNSAIGYFALAVESNPNTFMSWFRSRGRRINDVIPVAEWMLPCLRIINVESSPPLPYTVRRNIDLRWLGIDTNGAGIPDLDIAQLELLKRVETRIEDCPVVLGNQDRENFSLEKNVLHASLSQLLEMTRSAKWQDRSQALAVLCERSPDELTFCVYTQAAVLLKTDTKNFVRGMAAMVLASTPLEGMDETQRNQIVSAVELAASSDRSYGVKALALDSLAAIYNYSERADEIMLASCLDTSEKVEVRLSAALGLAKCKGPDEKILKVVIGLEPHKYRRTIIQELQKAEAILRLIKPDQVSKKATTIIRKHLAHFGSPLLATEGLESNEGYRSIAIHCLNIAIDLESTNNRRLEVLTEILFFHPAPSVRRHAAKLIQNLFPEEAVHLEVRQMLEGNRSSPSIILTDQAEHIAKWEQQILNRFKSACEMFVNLYDKCLETGTQPNLDEEAKYLAQLIRTLHKRKLLLERQILFKRLLQKNQVDYTKSGDKECALKLCNIFEIDGVAPWELKLNERPTVFTEHVDKLVLRYGEDVNQRDFDSGKTPLHYAVEANDLCLVRVLLGLNADPSFADHEGATPIEIAIRKFSKEKKRVQERIWELLSMYQSAKSKAKLANEK